MKERFDHVLGHNVRNEMDLHRGRANMGEEFEEYDGHEEGEEEPEEEAEEESEEESEESEEENKE